MYPELTNLLPKARIRRFRRNYFLRVATLFVLLLSCLVILHGVLLLPSYIYAHQKVVREQTQLAGLNASLQTAEEKQVQVRLKQLGDNVTYLNRLATTTTASAAISAVLQIPRPGITISGVSVTPPVGSGQGQMLINGTAASRDSLQAYSLALGQLPFVSSANLPISAYAKDTDIPFTITVTGTLRP